MSSSAASAIWPVSFSDISAEKTKNKTLKLLYHVYVDMERDCNNCGNSAWKQLLKKEYPERRRERERTVQTVYECEVCGTEGKHFEHKGGTKPIFSGALRE